MGAVAEKIKAPELRFPKFEGSWGEKCLGEVSRIYDGTHQTPRYVKSGIPFYSVEHVTSGDFSRTKFIEPIVHERECRRVKMDQGDVLMTRIGSVGVPKLIDWKVEASFYVSLALIKPQSCLLGSYLCQSIAAPSTQREIWRRQIHVAFPKKINLGDIGKVIFHLPSIPEQQKIADFLTAVDERIAKLKRKKELLEEYKKGMMQKLFSQEIRFKDEDGNDFPVWEFWRLGALTTKTGKRNKAGLDLPIYSINNKVGFNPQADEFEGLDSVERGYDTSAYKVISRNTFAYNPARVNVGSLGYSGDLHDVIISSLYVCFQTHELIDDQFLWQYFRGSEFRKEVVRKSEGGVRLYLFYENFSGIPLMLPSLMEQQKIADVLNKINDLIASLNSQIDRAAEFKRGLLQKMFV